MSGCELLAYAVRHGLTAADFKLFSIGFITQFLDIQLKINKGTSLHDEEKKYYQLKGIYDLVQEKYKNGKIGDKEYQNWMKRYTELEGRYG